MSSPSWRLRLAAGALMLVASALFVATAWADPTGAKFERHAVLTCGSTSVNVVINGAGNWPVAHVLGSNEIFHPVQFLGESGVFTDPSGVPHPFSEPAGPPKGNADSVGPTVITCTFAVNATFPDGSHVVASGSLRGFFS